MVILQIPLANTLVTLIKDGEESFVDYKKLSRMGIKVQAKEVEFSLDGSSSANDLDSPYQSLPSSFSSLACKIHKSSHLKPWPYLEIKASPAKLLQGHNIFGPTDYRLCISELLAVLSSSLPELYDNLNLDLIEVGGFDNTFSFKHSGKGEEGRQFISHLRNVANRYLKPSSKKEEYETTVYFNDESRLMKAKVYLKYYEFKRALKKLNSKLSGNLPQYQSYLSDELNQEKYLEYSKNLIRFEATISKRKLQRLGVPTLLTSFIKYFDDYEQKHGKGSLCRYFWEIKFNDLIEALRGKNMKILSDEQVHNRLKLHFQTITPKGNISYSKADRLFGFYRRLVLEGWSSVYAVTDKNTFGRNKKDLLQVGFSIAQLQNLHGDQSNIVPLIKYIEIDFANQYPDWYVEPTSQALKHLDNVHSIKRFA